MDCAGAVTIEEFGMQFVKEIHGSYSNIIGLPLFEVRHALKTLGFQKWITRLHEKNSFYHQLLTFNYRQNRRNGGSCNGGKTK